MVVGPRSFGQKVANAKNLTSLECLGVGDVSPRHVWDFLPRGGAIINAREAHAHHRLNGVDHTSSITESRFRAVKFLSTLVRQMGSDVVYLESIPPMLSITMSDAKEDEASSCLVHA